MEKIKVAIVGLGHRGRYIAKMVKGSFDFVDMVAACDIDPALWYETQWQQTQPMKDSLPDTKFYEDYSQMIAENQLDFVLVETGADVHADFCIKALDRGINVFSDIPSVANLTEAKLLWEAEQNSTAALMTGANPNEWGFVNALVDLYQKGLLGKPYYMEAEYIHCIFNPEMSKQLSVHSPWRKALPPIRYCTHSLGPLLRIMEEDLRYAICLGTGQHINPDSLKDDMMAALLQTESGVMIRLLRAGAGKARIGLHSYRVFGTKGYFERVAERGDTPAVCRFNTSEIYGCAHKVTELPIDTMPTEYINNPKAGGHGGADYALFDHMFAAFMEKKPMPISLRDGLRMTLPGIYAAESAKRKGERLTIHYPWEAEFDADIRDLGI